MGATLWLDCSAGISGDMLVAALLDAGASEERVKAALESLPVQGFEIVISRVKKSGLNCCDFDVVLDKHHENHDHDMAYLYGHLTDAGEFGSGHAHGHEDVCNGGRGHGHDHARQHSHEHGHERACEHEHEHARGYDHSHEHRNLADVLAVIDAGELTPRAQEIAHKIFHALAHAESRAHGVPMSEVHFHEVGAIDSIADIVAIAVCIDCLGVDRVVVSELCEGCGTVRCQHGVLPVPVPAVLDIAKSHGIALRILNVKGELVTPTGAAAVAALRTDDALPERFEISSVGMGAGKRDYATSGILRAVLIEPLPSQGKGALADNVLGEVTAPNRGNVLEETLGLSTGCSSSGAFEPSQYSASKTSDGSSQNDAPKTASALDQDRALRLLQAVSKGDLRVEDALAELKVQPLVDLGFAQVDTHRALRQGVGEVIYGEGKTARQIVDIALSLCGAGQERVLATRIDEQKAAALAQTFGSTFEYREQARLGIVGGFPEASGRGSIVVAAAGTSDLPVAEEAAVTAEFLGNRVLRCYDVGVAGIHRLLAHARDIAAARVVIAVAGMEGALPSVVGGIASCPVIAVPTSVGYGSSFDGLAALLAMMNSCASGVSVVNIDNGFGAGYQASLINRD